VSDDEALLRRLRDLSFDAEIGSAELVVEVDGGAAAINPSLPLLWDASFLLVERAGLDPGRIMELAGDALAGHGLSHLTVSCREESEGARIAGEMEAAGWRPDIGVYMVARAASTLEATADAAERPLSEIEDQLREVIADCFVPDYDGPPEAVCEQMLAAIVGDEGNQGRRWFVAGIDGRLAACCCLIDHGGIGEIEYVGTLRSARGQGLARAVVLAAREASAAAGDELTFLQADRDHWPAQLYERLGFEPVGLDHAFLRRQSPP
jgi:ribosomal protein S18 acetylase RimI-like enzyme